MSNSLISQALIMAAGRGNRMRPLTDTIPKPMVTYKEDTLIGNCLTELHKCVSQIHITVGYKKAMLSEYLMTRGGVDTIINTEGHGNAWWISNTVMKYVDEPIVVLTTDNVTEIDIPFLTTEYQRLNFPACMIVPVKPLDGIEGDYIHCQDGLVEAINREKVSDIYCSGIQIVNPSRITSLTGPLEDFKQVWHLLINQGELKVSKIYPNHWFSIDTIEQLAN